jgi:hypothetical protein
MNESCHSSFENYETGSPELACLQRVLEATPACSARASTAGFGGCCVALVARGGGGRSGPGQVARLPGSRAATALSRRRDGVRWSAERQPFDQRRLRTRMGDIIGSKRAA